MKHRDLMQKKNDWILYAYIINYHGGSTSIEQIRSSLTAWSRRNANTRRISQVMAMHKNKGFEKIDDRWEGRKFVSIWAFSGVLPEINKRTLQHWDEKLSPKGDN